MCGMSGWDVCDGIVYALGGKNYILWHQINNLCRIGFGACSRHWNSLRSRTNNGQVMNELLEFRGWASTSVPEMCCWLSQNLWWVIEVNAFSYTRNTPHTPRRILMTVAATGFSGKMRFTNIPFQFWSYLYCMNCVAVCTGTLFNDWRMGYDYTHINYMLL